MKSFTFFTIAAAAGLASAQSLSSTCMSSLNGILTSPDAACLSASSLLSFFVGTNQSVPDTINTWLNEMCSTGFCSNDTLAEIISNVTTGCASDLSSAGVDLSSTLTTIVQEVYPTVRNIMCLKDNASNQLCVTETLNNIQDVAGKLTLSNLNIGSLVAEVEKIALSAHNLVCTNCTKAAFTLASGLDQGLFSQASDGIDAVCGSGFIDGSSIDSDGVSQTANTEAFSTAKSNSALSLSASKIAGSGMLVVLTSFVAFA